MEIENIHEAWEGHTGQEVENFIKRSFNEEADAREEQHVELTLVNDALNTAITSLETALYPLNLSVVVLDDLGNTSSLLYKNGVSVDLTLSATVKHKGVSVTSSENTQYVFTNVATGETNHIIANKYEFENINSTCQLKVEAKYTYDVFLGVSNQLSASLIKTITFVDPSYIGFSDEDGGEGGTDVTVSRLTEKIVKTIVGSYTFELTENGYLWICIPTSGVTGFTRITLNGFDVPMQEAKTSDGYTYYRTSSMITPGTHKFILS